MLLTDYLAKFPRGRYGALLSGDVTERAGKLLAVMGSVDIGQYILECVLTHPGVGGDFSVQITRARLPAFLEALDGEVLSKWCERSPVWARTRELCRSWSSNPLFYNISDIWLEFDYEALEAEVPLPCVFFGAQSIGIEDALRGPVSILLGGAPAEDTSVRLRRCVSALSGIGLFQLGVMLGRKENPRPVRLFTNDLKLNLVVPFLNQAGWGSPEDRAMLEEFVNWAELYSDGLYILDFGVSVDGLTNKLGVCFAPLPAVQPMVTFLDALSDRCWALPEKSKDVKSWIERSDLPPLINNISHFKFSFDSTLKSVKVYLRHEHVPVSYLLSGGR